MTNELNSKRLNDDELEAVAGGVTPPSVDPAALAAQIMQSQLNTALAVAGGGGYAVDTHTPAHTGTDTGTPTITGQTHTTVAASDIFGGGSSTAQGSHSSSTESATISINLGEALSNVHLPPGVTVDDQPHYIEPGHVNTQGVFTKIIPRVEAQAPLSSESGGTYSIPNREGMAFNLAQPDPKKG